MSDTLTKIEPPAVQDLRAFLRALLDEPKLTARRVFAAVPELEDHGWALYWLERGGRPEEG